MPSSNFVAVDVYFDYHAHMLHRADRRGSAEVESPTATVGIEVTWKFFPSGAGERGATPKCLFGTFPLRPQPWSRQHARGGSTVRQGLDALERVHAALLALKHRGRGRIMANDRRWKRGVTAQLDLTQFAADLDELCSRRWKTIASRVGIGTADSAQPTFVLPTDQPAYLDLPPPHPEEAVAFWLEQLCAERSGPGRTCMITKRPRRPQ